VPCPVNTSTYNRLGSTLVRDPEFQDHVVAETRALLLTVSA
jgi:tRNA-dihydrouridine synthase